MIIPFRRPFAITLIILAGGLLSAPAARAGQQPLPRVYLVLRGALVNSFLLDSSFGSSDLHGMDKDANTFWTGADFVLDIRVRGYFGIGLQADFLERVDEIGERRRIKAGIRFAGLIPVGDSLVLVPFGRVGVASMFPDCEGCDTRIGYDLGTGFGLRWKIQPSFGLSVTLEEGVSTLMWDDQEGRFVDAFLQDISIEAGLFLAF